MTQRALCYIIGGYLSGSVLYALLFGRMLCRRDIREGSRDRNPGTTNAFQSGGFLCGVLTLCADLLKGFVPVFLYLRGADADGSLALALVLAAPVVGHIFPVFFGFQGGKGIAATFGCLLGLLPQFQPVVILAITFIFFSVVLRVTPHYHRTIATYGCAMGLMLLLDVSPGAALGFFLITLAVLLRMGMSTEQKDAMKVRLLWMR